MVRSKGGLAGFHKQKTLYYILLYYYISINFKDLRVRRRTRKYNSRTKQRYTDVGNQLKEEKMKEMRWIGTDKELEEFKNKIWNEALEEATKVCDKYESYGAAYEIRTMKK